MNVTPTESTHAAQHAAKTIPAPLPLQHWQITHEASGLTWLTFDQQESSANTFSAVTLAELNLALDYLDTNQPTALIFESGKTDSFVVGADIRAMSELKDFRQVQAFIETGYATFERISALPYPTLALISGACLGGGLEFALACRRRIVVDAASTRLGLPEVMLGIVPGWGGIKRLPATVGAPLGLDLMLTGRTLDADRALRAQLADIKVAPRLARQSARAHVMTRNKPARAGGPGALLNVPLFRKFTAWRAAKTVDARDPYHHYPAPRAILDIWSRHDGNPLRTLDQVETLFASATARNLVRVFFLQERLKSFARAKGETRALDPAPSHVHVIGAGTMGGDIAAWCAYKGMTVTLTDTDATRIAAAQTRARKLFAKRLRNTLHARDAFDRLIPDPEGHGVSRADIVLEAIAENAEAKRALYRAIEPRMKVDAVLATNTSSLLLSELYTALKLPQRLVGAHFFNPVARLPLVEIVSSNVSGAAYLSRTTRWVGMLGKLPLPVRDAPGFLVNAVLAPYMQEAILCVQEGMPPEAVDEAMLAFGMPMGPIELADKVGLDVVKAAGEQLVDVSHVPAVLQRLIDNGHLGEKTGKGFYPWRNGRAVKDGKGRVDPGLTHRLLAQLREKAQRQLDAGVVEDADLVDAGMIFGAGYAPFSGGPLHQASAGQPAFHRPPNDV